MAFLRMESVALKYPTDERWVLQDIDLEIREGEFVTVVGPSGCGKSSTIGLLSGLISPTHGDITWQGRPIEGPGPDRAVVFQDYSLFPWMTAIENIRFALEQSGDGSRESALRYLELVGLSDARDKYPGELSGGMRQRVAIARAFALDAPVYLMDEPFGAVDAKNRIYLQDVLLRLREEGESPRTVVLVTHDIDEALYLGDRVVIFSPGPGRIRRVIDVPFPRPRKRFQLVHDLNYRVLRNDILTLLQNGLLEELELVEGGAGI
ncbi:ATP-binding cassette domain-containing protein [Heliobacterium gestii]|uniref:ATP-binding cassette domain-containing protein n=1 Tax=Heliomicrobium gestii TaxID=2699 RepID=A0A845L8Q0_HELGE|nr:ABC transporter ATP-binding protein [Heliomicrobium gestii]MBM7866095.1 NitT/TauT family transport system ATP-binding protein [Heliomicrobium gestii]MZP42578.1 ATP-binding cassette domain-containing protein [Heliomicrobium gestii]